MTFNAVVLTPGRTGSHLICDNLANYFQVPVLDWLDEPIDGSVVHCHNPCFIPKYENTIGIISKRRDLLSTLISLGIAKKTKEYTEYTNQVLEPFELNEHDFQKSYTWHKNWYHLIDKKTYSKVIEIYYEDLINDEYHLFSKFEIIQRTTYYDTKSPYDHKKSILNYDKIKEKFDIFESKEFVSDEQQERMKKIDWHVFRKQSK